MYLGWSSGRCLYTEVGRVLLFIQNDTDVRSESFLSPQSVPVTGDSRPHPLSVRPVVTGTLGTKLYPLESQPSCLLQADPDPLIPLVPPVVRTSPLDLYSE